MVKMGVVVAAEVVVAAAKSSNKKIKSFAILTGTLLTSRPLLRR